MTESVLTPITQALQDGALSRRELKALMARSNSPAIWHLLLWTVVLALTTFLVYLCLGTAWAIPAMFVHGIVVVHHFSLQHECCHYTVFATRRLNDIVGSICGMIIILPHQFFRYEHCDHHTYTQLKGKDPELIELPMSLWKYLTYVSAVPYWWSAIKGLVRHAAGQLSSDEKVFLPKEIHQLIFWEARIYVAVYTGIAIASVALHSTVALWFWIVPMLLAQPVMRAIRMTEHVGRPNIADMKQNTRSNLVSRPMQFLCWNMNYHAEHHYASSVPFHALPKLHRKLDGYIYVEPRGYLGAHLDILRQLTGRTPRVDQTDNGKKS